MAGRSLQPLALDEEHRLHAARPEPQEFDHPDPLMLDDRTPVANWRPSDPDPAAADP
jgi:hypothetical protein